MKTQLWQWCIHFVGDIKVAPRLRLGLFTKWSHVTPAMKWGLMVACHDHCGPDWRNTSKIIMKLCTSQNKRIYLCSLKYKIYFKNSMSIRSWQIHFKFRAFLSCQIYQFSIQFPEICWHNKNLWNKNDSDGIFGEFWIWFGLGEEAGIC